MTVEQAIQRLKMILSLYEFDDGEDYLGLIMALSALRDKLKAEKNEPLTMRELLEMDGQPVWLDDSPNGWKCFIVNLKFPVPGSRSWSTLCGVDMWGRTTSLSVLVERGLYRRPPETR